jgi:hypothetical protein
MSLFFLNAYEEIGGVPYTPEAVVEFAFGYGPFHATPVWTDVSSFVKSVTTTHGRSSELDQFTAGTMQIVLDNNARNFDPLNTTGPWYAHLKPNVPVRVRALKASVYYPVWSGFVDGFDVTPGTITGDCTVSCTDAFGILATYRLANSVYETVIIADAPRGYWGLGAADSTVAADSSGNRYDATFDGIFERGQEDVVPYGHGGSVGTKGATSSGQVTVIPSARVDLSAVSIECWVEADTPMSAYYSRKYLYIQPQWDAARTGFLLAIGADSSTDQFIFAQFIDPTLNAERSWAADLSDGDVHHVVLTFTAGGTATCYVDAVPATVRATATGGVVPWLVANPVINTATTGIVWDGRVDDFAVYPVALTQAQVSAHYVAGTAPWDGDTTGGRITRVLDAIGWPAALRSIDNGEQLVGPARLAGRTALDYMQSIATTEQGRLFVDSAGKVTFHQRDRFITTATETTVQYTFDDSATGIMLDPSLKFSLNKSFIYNKATVTRVGGTPQTATDATSITDYGPRTRDISDLVCASDNVARYVAEWIVYRYKNPQVRASTWQVMPELRAADWATLLGLEVGHRVRLSLTPQATGTAISTDLHLGSIAHSITPEDWRITFAGEPTDNNTYFLWGSGLWGTGIWR